MSDKSLLIVRSGRTRPDSTFSCIAHDPTPGSYVALELENGSVSKRTVYQGSERRDVERLACSGEFNAVYADRRSGRHLMPFTYPADAIEADLNVFRRAKSDDEIERLTNMHAVLRRSMRAASSDTEFRGAVEDLAYEHALSTDTVGKHFVLKRYGIRDKSGMTVELSEIEPHTQDWKDRVGRMYAGCADVQARIAEGVSVDELDAAFRSHLDPAKDRVYGRVLHHTGYDAWEDAVDVDVCQRYDTYTIAPVVGDYRGNVAPLMHSVHAVVPDTFRGAAYRAATGVTFLGIDDFWNTVLSNLVKKVFFDDPTKTDDLHRRLFFLVRFTIKYMEDIILNVNYNALALHLLVYKPNDSLDMIQKLATSSKVGKLKDFSSESTGKKLDLNALKNVLFELGNEILIIRVSDCYQLDYQTKKIKRAFNLIERLWRNYELPGCTPNVLLAFACVLLDRKGDLNILEDDKTESLRKQRFQYETQITHLNKQLQETSSQPDWYIQKYITMWNSLPTND